MRKLSAYSIAKNIKKYRLLNKMTQEQLSELLELDTQYYAQLERGERNFTLEKVISVCSIFHVGIEDIVEIPSEENLDTSPMIQSLIPKLESLSYAQLSLVEKFISELIPYIK